MKIIEISKSKVKGIDVISATFLGDGGLLPLKVTSKDNRGVYIEVDELITSGRSAQDIAHELYNLMLPIGRVETAIEQSKNLGDNLQVKGGSVYFNDFKLEETLAEHMLSLLNSDDTPKDEKLWESYVRFLDNLHQNVDEDIRNQLFKWMTYENLNGNSFAITGDGCIVGYKGCIGDVLNPRSQFEGTAYVDGVKHVGQIPNPVGSVISMPRSKVQVDPSVGCSVGLHVGTYDYASNWAPILLLVKVNPRDIVSVPYEVESQKMRVCEYTVLEVTEGPLANMLYDSEEEYEENSVDYSDFWKHKVDVVYNSSNGETKLFTGVVVDLYDGSRPGLIVKSDNGDYKHIKYDRILEINAVIEQDSIDEILDELNNAKPGDGIYIEYNDDNRISWTSGALLEVLSDYIAILNNDGITHYLDKDRLIQVEIVVNDN